MTRFPEFFEQVIPELDGEGEDGLANIDRELTAFQAVDAEPLPGAFSLPDFRPEDEITQVRFDPRIEPLDLEELERDEALAGYLDNEARPISPEEIAVYRPWHVYREAWGIFVFARPFFGFRQRLADLASGRLPLPALVFRQVMHHEWSHFSFEVTATALEDLLGEHRYLEYLLVAGRPSPPLTDGPLEEVVASFREVAFARRRLPKVLEPKPSGYLEAVVRAANEAGPGYRDWRLMRRQATADRVLAAIASQIMGRPVRAHRWRNTTQGEKNQVPVYWVGNPSQIKSLGLRFVRAALPNIRRFEIWVGRNGGDVGAIQGTPYGMVEHRGQRLPYRRSSPWLLEADATRIAPLFGLGSVQELYDAVRALDLGSGRRA